MDRFPIGVPVRPATGQSVKSAVWDYKFCSISVDKGLKVVETLIKETKIIHVFCVNGNVSSIPLLLLTIRLVMDGGSYIGIYKLLSLLLFLLFSFYF